MKRTHRRSDTVARPTWEPSVAEKSSAGSRRPRRWRAAPSSTGTGRSSGRGSGWAKTPGTSLVKTFAGHRRSLSRGIDLAPHQLCAAIGRVSPVFNRWIERERERPGESRFGLEVAYQALRDEPRPQARRIGGGVE